MALHPRVKHIFLTLLIVVAVNLGVAILLRPSVAPAQVPGRQKFVYKVAHVRYDEAEIQAVVNIFSRDGWELVSHYNEILIFKRQM